jgi:hypothetical protein
MTDKAPSQFGGTKLTLSIYPSWQTAFTDYLASITDGTTLLQCLDEPLADDASAAARSRDRKVLGLMRNVCSHPVRVHRSGVEHAFDCWEGIKMLIVAV